MKQLLNVLNLLVLFVSKAMKAVAALLLLLHLLAAHVLAMKFIRLNVQVATQLVLQVLRSTVHLNGLTVLRKAWNLC